MPRSLYARSLLLAVALAGALLVAGCPTVSGTVELGTLLTLPDGGQSYLSAMLHEGQLVRWTKSPLKVALDTSRVPWQWQSYAQWYVTDALNQWQEASDGALEFQLVSSAADITITYVDTIPTESGITGGNTQITFGYNTFSRPQVTLALNNLTDVQIHASAVHEVGHALGLMGHSPNDDDVMTLGTYQTQLTPNDIATLRDLYRRQAWYTQE
jgi:predicted Zn-dependent protease